jgi:hypothetical protein
LTEYPYDSFGRIQQSKVWFDIGPQDYALECYSYDLAGNIIEKRIEDATNAVLLQKYYTYNLKGQCEEEYTFRLFRITVKSSHHFYWMNTNLNSNDNFHFFGMFAYSMAH